MTLVAIFLLAYLFVAPDNGTLTATRGAGGAVRAALRLPPRTRESGGSRSSRSSKKGGSRSLLAGWREGVASARKTREDGRDLWSRGSRAGGRVYGGTRNLAGGIRTTVRNRRDRRHQGNTPTPDAPPVVVADPTVAPAAGDGDQVHADLDERPVDVVNERDDAPSPDGQLLFSSKTDDLGAAIGDSAVPEQKTGELDEGNRVPDEASAAVSQVLEAPPADDRYYTWKSPVSGQSFVFDRMNLDEPTRATDERAAELTASFYNDRHRLATQNGEAAVALAETPTAAPAMGNTHHHSTWKEATPMAIAGTELGNLDEVDGEAKAALNAIEALTEALNEIKGWGGNLPDRWSGTSWSTDGLDAAIVGVAEEAAELKIPEGLMERLTQIGAEVQKARAVGEVAAETGAKGDLSGFRSN